MTMMMMMVVTMVTECDCSPEGSVIMTSPTDSTYTPCDHVTGQCECLNPGIGGHRCDSCRPATSRKYDIQRSLYSAVINVKGREICIAPHRKKLTSEALTQFLHCKHTILAFTA